MLERRIPSLFALMFVIIFAGGASAQSTTLEQAKGIYTNVDSNGGSNRAPSEMARARTSIDAADSAIANGHNQALAEALATQALHDAQAAEAADSRIHDRQVTDSLHAYRLTQLVALSQRQRDELFKQNQLSHAEIVDLRAQNLLTVTQSDSLRLQLDSVKAASASAQEVSARQLDSARVMQAQVVRQQDSVRIAQAAANEVRSSSSRQTDSLRAVADRAQRQVDSIRYASQQASRAETEAERLRTDSLMRAARSATAESDSLRRLVGRSASLRDSLRVRDSVRAVTDLSSRTADSLRITQAVLGQTRALEKLRSDSIQRSSLLAAQIADSMRAASIRASAKETAAERVRSDSLRKLAELGNLRLDSLRRSEAATQRQRDSVQALAAISAKQVDSLRSEAANASRTRDSLRADVEARTKLSASVSDLSRTALTLKQPTLSPRGLVVTINDASFVNGTTAAGPKTLTKVATRDLGKLTPVIATYSSYHIEVQGYADSTARLEKGDALADARAQAVREALIAGGLDAGRIETKAMGHVSPVATNATIVGRRANRRVEIVVVGSGAQ
ncbi:MAG: OmpA family protein [Gemmatimonadaceae bacterium]|nr:OmpA family protein [Gemmatimonadaceae bacterium]